MYEVFYSSFESPSCGILPLPIHEARVEADSDESIDESHEDTRSPKLFESLLPRTGAGAGGVAR